MSENTNSAKQMLNDAKSTITDLESEINNFFESKPYQIVIEHNAKSGMDTHKIKLVREIPGQFRSMTRHIASDIRSSLDHLGYAAAVASGKRNPRKTYFPFAKSFVDAQNLEKSGSKDIPSEIFKVFLNFQPYLGGNNTLWSLNEISNCNKHRSIVPVAHGLHGGQMMNNFSCSGLCEWMGFPPKWDTLKNEAILCIVDNKSATTYDIRLQFNICFGDIQSISGAPTLDVLKYLAHEADAIISATEIKGIELGLFS